MTNIQAPLDWLNSPARKTITSTLCLLALTIPSPMLKAQEISFSGDLTAPSSSLMGPQVTTGPVSSAVNLGSLGVCPNGVPSIACVETQVLAYTVQVSGNLGPTQVVTEGISGLDFKLTSSSCTGPQAAGVTCQVSVSFSPLAPGLRRGAVIIQDTSSHALVTTYLYGSGVAPAIGFAPPAETNMTTGPNHPQGVAVDAQGDLFYTGAVQGTLLEVPQNARLSQVVLDTGFSNPSGVALDGAGNIYVADTGHNLVLKIPPGGGPGVPIGLALSSPSGVAVDGLGNVYISNPPINYVVVVPINGGPEVTVGGGYLAPAGIALDASGNLFVADTGNSRVLKVPPNGAPQTTIGSGFHGPLSVAVDTAGNVFVGDAGANSITEVPIDGSLEFPLGNGFISPSGMALGSDGNLYIADQSRAEVVQLDRGGPPNLTFDSTVVGEISLDSPQWVTVENIGSSPLPLMPSPTTIDPDFVLVHGPTELPYCTAGLTVSIGGGCVLSISFQPKSIGTFTSAYVLSDNALNTSSNQSIGLSGTSTGITPQLFLGFNPQVYYGSSFLAIAVSNSPGPITFSLVSGPATVSPTGTIKVIGEGLVTVRASQAASGNYLAATTTGSFESVLAGTTTSIAAVTVKSGFGTAAELTVTVHPDTSGVPTGHVYLSDGATLLSKPLLAKGTATYTTGQLTAGTHVFAAAYGGDANFAESVSSGVTVVVPESTVTLHVLHPTVVLPLPVVLQVDIDATAKKIPHGRIEIFDGSAKVASFRILAAEDGETPPMPLVFARGVHVLTAFYKGDPIYQPGQSAPVTITVK